MKDYLAYICMRAFLALFSWMPYSGIRRCGKILGLFSFYILKEFRKSSLSNLALAKDLQLSPKACYTIAKQSFQNLAITCLEFAKLAKDKKLDKVIRCENPEEADTIMASGKGIIFFCGHQSNWEALFFDGTRRMQGAAIGKTFKNPFLSRWIQQGRERFGGKIIAPKKAFKEGLFTLRKGTFLGIVDDQGMPDSGYSYPFLGRKMWFSPLPALLAIRCKTPIIVATTKRTPQGYSIHYGKALWPQEGFPLQEETKRLMDLAVGEFEKSIKENPSEWFWQHNCWKQQTPDFVFRRFRKDSILLILPDNEKELTAILPHLSTFRTIYPQEFLYLMVPKNQSHLSFPLDAEEIFHYENRSEIQRDDLRFKLVYNFSSHPISKHFLALSSFEVITLPDLEKIASPYLPKKPTLSDILLRAITRKGTLWEMSDAP